MSELTKAGIEKHLKTSLKKDLGDEYQASRNKPVVTMHGPDRFALTYYTPWVFDLNEAGNVPVFSVISQDYAPNVVALTLIAEDEGVNGTQYWELQPLVDDGTVFENLTSFRLPLNGPDDHNGKIVVYDDMYEENNALGKLLDKCPQLRELAAPSSPGPQFFERPPHPLQTLTIQCGFDLQNFVANLAQATCFPELTTLSFRDYAETYMDDYAAKCATYADYAALLNSPHLPALRRIELLDTQLHTEQQQQLTAMAESQGRTLRFGQLGGND